MSQQTKHTPGPWVEIPSRGDYVIQERRRSNRKRIIASVDGVNGEANARLIAASPALYDFTAEKAREGDASAKSTLDSLGLTY